MYVADLAAQTGSKNPTIVFGGSSGIWGTMAAMGGVAVETPGYQQARRENTDRERAEEKRLFYVAATRAKDLLVVSCWRPIRDTKTKGLTDARNRDTNNLGRFWKGMDPIQFPGLVAIASPEPSVPTRLEVVPLPDVGAAKELARSLEEVEARGARLAHARSLPLRRAGGHDAGIESQSEDRPREDREPAATPSRAERIGSAVHEAMQAVVERSSPPKEAADEASAAWELVPAEASEVRRLVGKLVASDLFRRSGLGSRRLTEIPVLFRDSADFLVEGKIDLLFEEDGEWLVVDYKTDRWKSKLERDDLARESVRVAVERLRRRRPRSREEREGAIGVDPLSAGRGCDPRPDRMIYRFFDGRAATFRPFFAGLVRVIRFPAAAFFGRAVFGEAFFPAAPERAAAFFFDFGRAGAGASNPTWRAGSGRSK